MRLRISVDPSGTSASGRLLLSLDISYSIRWKWRQEEGRGREEKGRKKERKKETCSEQVIESGQLIVRVLARFFVNPLLTESIHPQPAATAQAVRLLSLVKS